MSYYKSVLKGVSWLGFLQGVFRVFSLIKFFIIIRVLTPLDLGLFGVASLVLVFFETTTETGINSFLIQHKKNIDEYINTAWVISIVRGIILTICVLIIAWPVTIFFKQEKAIILLYFISLIPLIKGFANPSAAKFFKHLEFHKEFVLRTSGAFFESLFAVIFVIFLKSPIALIYSLTLSTLIETTLTFVMVRPLPSFSFNKKMGMEIVHFSKWITLTGFVSYLSTEFDSIIVGRLLGVADLGIYQISQKFSLQILSEGGDVVAKVIFPIFAQISQSKERLKLNFYKTLLAMGVIVGFPALILYFFAHPFILLFLGKSWINTFEPFRIFVLLGVLSVLMSIITSLFLSVARQDLTAKLVIFRTTLLVIFIFPLTGKFGVVGASLASLLSFLLIYPLAVRYIKKILY